MAFTTDGRSPGIDSSRGAGREALAWIVPSAILVQVSKKPNERGIWSRRHDEYEALPHGGRAGVNTRRRSQTFEDWRTMIRTVLRTLVAVVIALLVAFVLVVAVELFSAVVHPLPEDFGGSMEEMCRHVQRYPPWVLAVVVPAWAVTALVSTWIAQRIGNLFSATIVGLFLLASLVFNISMLPYPMWFKIVNLLVIPAAIIAGSRLSRRGKSADIGRTN